MQKQVLARITSAALFIVSLLIGALLISCASLPPALNAALIGFGKDVIQSAAQNFLPQYADSASSVMLALAETATGQPFTQQSDGELVALDAGFDDAGLIDETVSYAQQTVESGYEATVDGYSDGIFELGEEVVAIEASILKQSIDVDGLVELSPVADGDRLLSDQDPAMGDKVKFFFRTNCACFVYLIGVDSTSWITRIFPVSDYANPVPAGVDHLVPDGDEWWGLDEFKGIETVYFVVSRDALTDLELHLASLPMHRPPLPRSARTVQNAPIIPSRGLVRVSGGTPVAISTAGAQPTVFNPQGYVSEGDPNALVVTRWFHHD